MLKVELVENPVLKLSNWPRDYIVDTDAWGKHIGCVRRQKKGEWTDWLIQYWSCSLNSKEQAYEVMRWEWLAAVSKVLMVQPYIDGGRFTVHTDHEPFK